MNMKGSSFLFKKCKISILSKYIIKQAILPFFSGFLIFSFILLMERIFQLFDFLISKHVSLGSVIGVFLYSLPFIIALTIPMGVLVASIATYGRMSGDLEILAIRALGINPLGLTRGSFLTSLFITIGMVFFNMYILPESNFKLKKLYLEISRARPTIHLHPEKFNELSEEYTLWIKEIDHSKSVITNIILKEDIPGKPIRTIYAREGKMEVLGDSLIFHLSSGEMHIFDQKDPFQYKIVNFDNYILSISLKKENLVETTKGYREMNLKELLKNARETEVKRKKWRYLLEAHKKFSIPFASLIFVLVGVPIGIQMKKGGVGNGITLSFFLFMIYYIMLIGGEELCERGYFYPSLSMWAPNIVLGITGLYLFYKIIYEK
ncbi:MAG: LptF/LptG family permease [candidate division WOR-3 bacterium]